MDFFTEILNSKHIRKDFSCGKPMLDDYFQKQANQDMENKLSVCFVRTEGADHLVSGFYTLSNASVPLENIPEKFSKKFPKSYVKIPATLLGRLAVDQNFKGQNIGKLLLIDALRRSLEISEKIGSFAVIVDPIDLDAEKFYEKFGFIKLSDSGKMFLPMNTIKSLFSQP